MIKNIKLTTLGIVQWHLTSYILEKRLQFFFL